MLGIKPHEEHSCYLQTHINTHVQTHTTRTHNPSSITLKKKRREAQMIFNKSVHEGWTEWVKRGWKERVLTSLSSVSSVIIMLSSFFLFSRRGLLASPPLLNVPSSVTVCKYGYAAESRHIVIWCRFALAISNLLKWQRKLHNPKSLSLHTNTDACTPLILYSPTACNSMSMCAHVSPTSESQMHPSQHLHGATRTQTPAVKEREQLTKES